MPTVSQKLQLLILVLIPATANASGGDVISLMLLELGLLVGVIIFLVVSRLPLGGKAILFAAYVASVTVALLLTSGMPYSKNLFLINTVSILIPILAVLTTWKLLTKKS